MRELGAVLQLVIYAPEDLKEALEDPDPQAFAAAADIETGWARQPEDDPS